ncbi:fanconi-associated nuclease 1 isoform 1-T1 [Synchiropus picturatus]
MTETNKDKPRRSLSLSKSRKKNVAAAASRTVNTPPIASFFSTPQPSRVACPLCGQLVPKFRINEHIDLQCKNFERGDNFAASASQSDVRSIQMTPGTNSPELAPKSDEVRESKTCPYFKKSHAKNEKADKKTVVRKLDLGSLSSKLSRNCEKTTERTKDKQSHHDKVDESLFSSQKENLSIQDSKDGADSVIDLTDERPTCDEKSTKTQASVNEGAKPKKLSLTKRKKESNSGVLLESPKKAKYETKGSTKQEVDSSSEDKLETKDISMIRADGAKCSDTESPKEKTLLRTSSDKDNDLPPGPSFQNTTGDQVDNQSLPRLPYYLRNFQTVLQAVLQNEDDRLLFNEEDLSHIQSFEKLSVKGQKLYVRLFQRKLKWLQVNKLDYVEISSDLGPVAEELGQGGLVQTERDLQDIGEALDLLPAPELKTLAKTFHLGSTGTQKQHLVDGLLRLSKQKSLFSFKSGQNNIGDVILKRAKRLAGTCIRLCRPPRAVFSRILLLFSLTDTMDEEEMAAGGQNQLYTILLVNSGRLAFPDYTIQRVAKLFRDRDDLIRYEAAMRSLLELVLAMQGGHWEEALELYTNAKTDWTDLQKNHDFSYQEELPVFLRSFTTGWAFTRILSRGVEILQRLRRYEDAVEELRSLLQQSVYCPDSRGRWWDRLALNLQQHLKKTEQAIDVMRDGLLDPLVRTGHKLSLHQRAMRMSESASFKKYHRELKKLPTFTVQDVRHVTIRGQLLLHEGSMGKSRFVLPADGEDEEGSTVICSVEELSLAHYRQQGFDQGIHGEGSTFSTLFAFLLWDIIFMEGIPDVFRNPYQTCPLDFYTDCFYENRREAIDSRVELLREASVETLHSMLEDVWTSQEGKVCSCVNWERFSSLNQAQSLVSCFGGVFLGGVIARMAKDFRHCRAGLPDLVVWSTLRNTYKLVEVKGPNDRLSQKQQIWLDELQKLGADVEVCHVVATGARGARLE